MEEIGKFVWDNVSADLKYTADFKSGIYNLTLFDEEGSEFFDGLDVGNEIALHKSNRDILRMVVIELIREPLIRCKAQTMK